MNENDGDAKDSAVRMAHEHDVKFIRSKFTDILGLLKSFAITVEKLEDGF
jgi:glutamine synthetase